MEVIEIRLDTENGTYICETYESTSIQISRRVQSLEVLEGSQATFTKQSFTLPLQGELLKALGDITDPKSDFNVDIRKSIPGSILISGVTAYEGSYIITGANFNPNTGAKEVDLIFKGDESSIKSRTNNVLLKDLLADYTIPYNYTEIVKSLVQVGGTTLADVGYIYLLAELGQNFVPADSGLTGTPFNDLTNPFDHDNFKPAINFKYILDAIESELGLVISYDTEIEDLVENQILYLHNNEKTYPELDTSPLDGSGEMTVNTYYNVTSNLSTYQKINYQAKSIYSDDNFNLTNDSFVAPFKMTAGDGNLFKIYNRIRFVGNNSGLGSIACYVFLYVNGVRNGMVGSYTDSLTTIGAFDFYVTIERELSLTLEEGDEVDVRVIARSTFDVTLSYYGVPFDCYFRCVQMSQVQPDSNVLVGANVDPELTVWDCIRHIISQCNGIVEPTLSGFNIKPWVKWVDEGEDLILDDYGIDSTKDLQFIPTGVTGAKSIELKYAEADDFYSEQVRKKTGQNYGTQLIEDTGSDFATDTFKVELPFAQMIPVPISQSNVSIPKIIDEDGNITKDKMYVSFFTGELWDNIVVFKDKNSNAIAPIKHPVISHWMPIEGGFDGKDMNFGKGISYFAATGYPNNTLYNRFWKRYIQECFSAQAMEVKASIYLPKVIAQGLKLNERIFYNGYTLRFNALENYSINDDEPIDVEMVVRTTVENIDIAPFYPYDVIDSIVQWKDSSNNNTLSPADGSTQTPADVKASCIAYGFFYDSVNNIGIEQGKLIIT